MLKPPSHSTENPELFRQRYSELGTLLFLGAGLILTAVLIVLISGTLRSIHSSLPSTSLLLSRDIHIMANHLGRTRDAIVSVRATPSMTMLHGLEVATKRLNMAFFRDDDHRLAGVSPDLARLAGTIPPTIASIHEMVAKGPPVSTSMLEHALATVEAGARSPASCARQQGGCGHRDAEHRDRPSGGLHPRRADLALCLCTHFRFPVSLAPGSAETPQPHRLV